MAKKTVENSLSQEDRDFKHRTEQFLEEVKLRGGFTKLYNKEHTSKVVKQQGIEKGYFPKLFTRMLEGIGLYL